MRAVVVVTAPATGHYQHYAARFAGGRRRGRLMAAGRKGSMEAASFMYCYYQEVIGGWGFPWGGGRRGSGNTHTPRVMAVGGDRCPPRQGCQVDVALRRMVGCSGMQSGGSLSMELRCFAFGVCMGLASVSIRPNAGQMGRAVESHPRSGAARETPMCSDSDLQYTLH